MTVIYMASDHAGFELKQDLVSALSAHGYTILDMGPTAHNPNDDYPDYIKPLMGKMGDDDFGIVICKNGVGVTILSNRSSKIRCALSWNVKHIKSARNDDDANVLALPADYIDKEAALEISLAFLETPFSMEERHQRRLEKINDYSGNI